jgi:hypothetical protein
MPERDHGYMELTTCHGAPLLGPRPNMAQGGKGIGNDQRLLAKTRTTTPTGCQSACPAKLTASRKI